VIADVQRRSAGRSDIGAAELLKLVLAVSLYGAFAAPQTEQPR
jgi:hypothetical protein